jgi:hypothetical protein
MVIAALVAFAILLIAWIVAPSGSRRTEPEVTSTEVAEPIAA